MSLPTRRQCLSGAAAAISAALIGCKGGEYSLFGYQCGSRALYDPKIHTVYVAMFNNRSLQTTPNRELEVTITRAVIQAIGDKTPFHVLSDPNGADTELLGNFVDTSKTILNRDQENLTREAELVLTLDVLWRDLRTGKNLSAARQGRGLGAPGPRPTDPPVPFDPTVPQPPIKDPIQSTQPVRIVATGRVIPELGESNATAQQKAVNSLATQIVSLMEKPW